ncbi:MAG: bifunctional hydroxymethylpyrimidine kinase/phosphomethylpyrimidine kinase [Dethiobacter sp.]|jgi:hydroxymethylpyrimidine/phosphomethylpyrimidine kinase|nr:MAG: bifunctional hydroxymethylpyrimidine kinase/phosphomethylpyrimidine kinase [Dethiobacter sp.]
MGSKTTPKCVLTIAGSDSGAGAGIQADLKAIAAQGVYGLSAITAITAQNTVGVEKVQILPADMVEAQIDAVLKDFPVAVVKTGMLGNAEIIQAVAARLKQHNIRKIVLDPVMVAKSGDLLLEGGAQETLQEKLLPLALLVTPNIPEAEILCGRFVKNTADLKKVARALRAMGPSFVLLKGGHLMGNREVTDILFDGEKYYYYRASRIATENTHGTGCTYASAIAAHLALGKTVPQAVKAAREYLQAILPYGLNLGHGHGPMDHFSACLKEKR